MDTLSEINLGTGKAQWHIKLEFIFEGGEDDTCQDGVQKIRTVLKPIIENGSGIKQVFLLSLPEKD